MINFLIKIKQEGSVEDIIWSYPAHIFLASSDNLFQQIEFGQWTQLEQDIQEAIKKERVLIAETQYVLRVFQEKMFMFFIRSDKNVFVLGYQVEDPVCRHTPSQQLLATRFLTTVVALDNQHTQFSEASKTNYYEKIQALNNDLINMQRELHKANAQLNQLNKTLNNRLVKDPLTGLISRYQYEDEMTRLIQNQKTKYGVFAFIDIDDFKQVNDTYGHQVGDEYLKEFAKRLALMDVPDILRIRIAGDEFGLYAHGYSVEEIYHVIDKITMSIKENVIKDSMRINEYTLNIQLCVGFAIYNLHSDNVYQLIDYADFAMYQAKKQGKGRFKTFDMAEYVEFRATDHHE